ncbi:hypothetical protein [Agrobacterium rosae]|uniref:hypothetical protein n=1 Tax=Agrobacterium rosae TaxID=1972867 RepID=UPI00122ECFA4|nr:hypothetical protein [Agrobacterium rosae]KAA3510092.1 hypothetical protein DXM21_19880 [Agrobacterium rosae]KAA3514963.1 hypothetical protein DXM25_20490 [Agrobacterium rosae]MQB50712.1 hypothetical protein [Agrobacterium rosae]
MKYNAPFGSTDPNAPYVDRNTPGAIAGSRVPAAALEHTQREIMAVIVGAGLDPSSTDLTQLLQAIQKIIDAATGGAGDENYVLMTQARVRLPLFPEVQTADGRLAVISPSNGVVRLMPGYDFFHRGIFAVTTVQQDFATTGNKVYHLRWNPNDGYVLRDLASAVYNPAGLAEESPAFDTTYDDMLIARVVTNASNFPTIVTLSNKADIAINQIIDLNSSIVGFDSEGAYAPLNFAYNWARTPRNFDLSIVDFGAGNGIQRWIIQQPDGSATGYNVNRYRIAQRCSMDQLVRLVVKFSARG